MNVNHQEVIMPDTYNITTLIPTQNRNEILAILKFDSILMTKDPAKQLDAAMNTELENGTAVFQTINNFLRLSVSTRQLVTLLSSSKIRYYQGSGWCLSLKLHCNSRPRGFTIIGSNPVNGVGAVKWSTKYGPAGSLFHEGSVCQFCYLD